MDLINSHRGPGEDEEYYLTAIRLQTLVERRSKSVDVYVLKRIDPIDLQNIEEFVKLTDKSIPQKATNLRNTEEEKKDDIQEYRNITVKIITKTSAVDEDDDNSD